MSGRSESTSYLLAPDHIARVYAHNDPNQPNNAQVGTRERLSQQRRRDDQQPAERERRLQPDTPRHLRHAIFDVHEHQVRHAQRREYDAAELPAIEPLDVEDHAEHDDGQRRSELARRCLERGSVVTA